MRVKGGNRRKLSTLTPKTQARIQRAREATFLPTVELVLYQARGEWRYSLSVFDSSYRSITSEGCLGDNETRARVAVLVIANRLGLQPSQDNANIWRRLVPSGEF